MLVPSLKWYPRDGGPVDLLVDMKRSAKESEEQPKQYEQKHSEISSSPRIRIMFGNAELTGFVEVCFQVSTSQKLSAMLNHLKIVQQLQQQERAKGFRNNIQMLLLLLLLLSFCAGQPLVLCFSMASVNFSLFISVR
ncbi:unnamed protein product [Musa acuminata subsp. burmannicoides]